MFSCYGDYCLVKTLTGKLRILIGTLRIKIYVRVNPNLESKFDDFFNSCDFRVGIKI